VCVLAAAAQLAGCRCVCGGEEALARVVEVAPVTEVSARGAAWTAAAVDVGLDLGDALRTGEAGRATLEVFGQGRVKVGPGSLVRFGEVGQRRAPGAAAGEVRLVLENGELQVETEYEGAPALVIAGPGGSQVRLGQGARARWVFDDAEQLQLAVEAGSASVEQGGATTEIGAGQSIFLGEAEALDARPAPDAGAAVAVPAPVAAPDAAPDAGADAQGLVLRGVDRDDLEVRAPGEDAFSQPRGRLILAPGAEVRVTGSRVVTLEGPDGASVLLQPGARATFGGVGGGRIRVTLAGGAAEGRSAGAGVAALTVPGGAVETVPAAGAAAYLASVRDRHSTRVAVREGLAQVSSGGRTERLLTGAETVLGEAALRITRSAEIQPVFQGGSAVVYDPERTGNFTIRFQPLPECSTYAIRVDHGGRRYLEAVTDQPMLALRNVEYGDYGWRAACLVDGVPQPSDRMGKVARRPDASRAALPTQAPRTTLDSDGRSYTVTYQNLLPAVTLRWAKAPPADSYALEVVEERTGQKVHNASSPRAAASFKSGFFREGRYLWFFRATSAGKRLTSPITSAQLAYDNVAPAIQILDPQNGAPAAGSVRARGVAVIGSTVTVNGVNLDLGADFRFDQEVPVRGNLVVFRVTSPRRGTGYYLRHLGGGGGGGSGGGGE
jgi:hypothetical protein